MNKLLVLFVFIHLNFNGYTQDNNDTIKIFLKDAVDIALKNNPSLKVFKYEIATLEGIKSQAGLLPNPEAEFEAENFLGGNELNGFTGAEYTLSASYLWARGKRGSRINLADKEINSAQSNYELSKFEIIAQVKTAFLL